MRAAAFHVALPETEPTLNGPIEWKFFLLCTLCTIYIL